MQVPKEPALLPNSLPGYLISLKPRLRLEDQEVASGGVFALGSDLHGTYSMSQPTGGWFHSSNNLVVGAVHLFGMDLQSISQSHLVKQSNRTATSVLNEAAMAYFAEVDAYLDTVNDLGQGYTYRHPSFGTFSTAITTKYNWGIPATVTFSGVSLDLDRVAQSLATDDPSRRLDLIRSIGLKLSTLEHEIPELYLTDAKANSQAVSAVKALALATAEGQRIYQSRPKTSIRLWYNCNTVPRSNKMCGMR